MFAWFARILTGMIGMKMFAGGLLMIILGVILYNLTVEVIEEVLNFGLTKIASVDVESPSGSISGFAAWLLGLLKLPECISLMASCTIVRFIARKIPFIKW